MRHRIAPPLMAACIAIILVATVCGCGGDGEDVVIDGRVTSAAPEGR